VNVNIKRCEVQFSLIFLFFGLMGKGPGVLNTVLKRKTNCSENIQLLTSWMFSSVREQDSLVASGNHMA
jgi:hypothetical protein